MGNCLKEVHTEGKNDINLQPQIEETLQIETKCQTYINNENIQQPQSELQMLSIPTDQLQKNQNLGINRGSIYTEYNSSHNFLNFTTSPYQKPSGILKQNYKIQKRKNPEIKYQKRVHFYEKRFSQIGVQFEIGQPQTRLPYTEKYKLNCIRNQN